MEKNHQAACEEFLLNFDRTQWLHDHGEWSGEEDMYNKCALEAYIMEGEIDPDGVSNRAEKLKGGDHKEVWGAHERWTPFRVGDALYIRWVRYSYSVRHDRDLWIKVDPYFFD